MAGDGKSFYTVADTIAPAIKSATIGTDGVTLTIVLSEAVTGHSGFTITPSGGAAGLTYSSGDGTDTLVFALDRTVYDTETATGDYAPGDVEDVAGNALETAAGFAVTNNSTQTAPFSPLDLSPVVWLDGLLGRYQETSSPTTVAGDTDPVGTWQDQSGNGHDATAPGDTQRPLYDAAAKALLFDGGNDKLVIADAADLDITGDLTLVLVGGPHDQGNYYFMVTKTTGGGAPLAFEWRLDPSSGLVAYVGDAGAEVLSDAAPSALVDNLLAVTRTGGVVTHYLNGATNGSGADNLTPAATATPLAIGGRNDNFAYYKGHIASALIFDYALSAGNLSDLFAYLNDRFSIY